MCPEEIWAAYGLTCPPRVGTLRDPSRKTYGRSVARVAARLGTPMMPWQRYSVDVAMEVDPDTGSLVYRNVRLIVPRQSGKTTEVLSVTVHRMTEMGRQARRYRPSQGTRQRSLYAAQKLIDARDKFVDEHIPLLDASPYADRYRKRLKNGAEALLWDTGGLQGITASGETSGHGKVLDLGFEDEAFAATDNRLEAAFSPAMITRWSPQHWVVTTEGTEQSLYLAQIVEDGRTMVEAGERTAICYMEWSDLEGDRDDQRTWLRCMPALCPSPGRCECDPDGVWHHTVQLDTIRAERDKMASKLDEFDRAYLNRRRKKTPPPDPNVPPVEVWRERIDVRSRIDDGGAVAFGIDMTPSRSHAAIAVAGPCPAGWHLEVVDYREGTDWIPARARELVDRWDPVAVGIDVAGPCGSLLVPLSEVGIDKPGPAGPARGDLWIPTTRQACAACGTVADAIRAGRIRHLGQQWLMDAYANLRTRQVGDAWMWARRASSGDICPMCAGTVAVGALEDRKALAAAGDYDPVANVR